MICTYDTLYFGSLLYRNHYTGRNASATWLPYPAPNGSIMEHSEMFECLWWYSHVHLTLSIHCTPDSDFLKLIISGTLCSTKAFLAACRCWHADSGTGNWKVASVVAIIAVVAAVTDEASLTDVRGISVDDSEALTTDAIVSFCLLFLPEKFNTDCPRWRQSSSGWTCKSRDG